MAINILTLRPWKLEKHQRVPLWKWKKFLSPILMKFKTCNPYSLRIWHRKFEWNWRQKIFPDSKGGPFDDFMKIRKIPKGPPFGKKKFFVSDFTQILCVRSWDHKDFRFWVSSKNFFKNFFPFSPNARGPPKIFDVPFFQIFW